MRQDLFLNSDNAAVVVLIARRRGILNGRQAATPAEDERVAVNSKRGLDRPLHVVVLPHVRVERKVRGTDAVNPRVFECGQQGTAFGLAAAQKHENHLQSQGSRICSNKIPH